VPSTPTSRLLKRQMLQARSDHDRSILRSLGTAVDGFRALLKMAPTDHRPPLEAERERRVFYLTHASFFVPAARPKQYRKRKDKACFYNAQELAVEKDDLIYCEGQALTAGGYVTEVEHAWCVTPDGMVVDVTWAAPGLSYFGVPFTRSYLRQRFLAGLEEGAVGPLFTSELLADTGPDYSWKHEGFRQAQRGGGGGKGRG
jgi:hypothetical protein